MNFKWILAGVTLAALVVAVMALRPVPQPTPENTETVSAVVAAVRVSGTYDVFFEVPDREGEVFYINRGAERGLDPEALEAYVQGKVVDLTYVKHRSLFDPGARSHHLVEVSCGDSLIFAQ